MEKGTRSSAGKKPARGRPAMLKDRDAVLKFLRSFSESRRKLNEPCLVIELAEKVMDRFPEARVYLKTQDGHKKGEEISKEADPSSWERKKFVVKTAINAMIQKHGIYHKRKTESVEKRP